MKEAELPISELNLDLRNYRIGQQDTQQDAIKAIIEDQDDRLVNLAEDILDIGLSPAELLIVTPDEEDSGFYTVLEGNRRVTALKLMDVPTLGHGTSVHSDFAKLAPRFAKKPVRRVRCVIMDSRDAAMPWIERRHSSQLDGRGQDNWKPRARANFEAEYGTKGKSGVRPSKAVLDLLFAKKKIDKNLPNALKRKTTTMDRVFRYKSFGDETGIRIDREGNVSFDSGDTKAGLALLQKIIDDMSRAAWNVNVVRTAAQQHDYLQKFAGLFVRREEAKPKGGGGIPPKDQPKEEPKEEPKDKKSGKGKGPKKDTLGRATLANTRKDLAIQVKNNRLNRMYLEARRIQPTSMPNACGVLMRAFLEMTVENYLVRNKVPVPASLKGKAWNDLGVSLDAKVKGALDQLDPTSKAREWGTIRKGFSYSTAPHSIGMMHSFVHDVKSEPDPMQLKRIWEAWEEFLRVIHGNTP